MKPFQYSKTHSLVNLSSSILNFFGVKPFHTTIPEIDKLLINSKKKKVALVLFDGLGKNIKNIHLRKEDALIRKSKIEITSIYPPTTVAATNAVLSGKYPFENGWLGWNQHFNDLNVTLDMFTNTISKTNIKYKDNLSYDRCGYKNIVDLINENGDGIAKILWPSNINNGEADNLKQFFRCIENKMQGQEKTFLYAYWPDPDHTIHDYGTKHPKVCSIVREINLRIARLARQIPDTLILVIADHGLIDAQYEQFDKYPDLYELLEYPPYLDARSLWVKIKEGQKNLFLSKFKEYFSDDYLVFSKEEVLEKELFGFGIKHPEFDNFLGDYLIVCTNEKTLDFKDINGDYSPFIACHSGMSEEEYLISVAVFNN